MHFEHLLLWCKWWPFKTQTQDAFDRTQFLMACLQSQTKCLQIVKKRFAGAYHSWKMHTDVFLQIASATGNGRNGTKTIDGMLTSLQ